MSGIMTYLSIIAMLLGGCGVFLVGCKLLSDNMEKAAGKGVKKLFDKTSDNRVIGVGIGTVSTAIVQSSGLTTVMVVGLVNSGIITLMQATSVIMGANIGTTITGWLAVLGTVDFTFIFLVFAFVGIFMAMFSKNSKINTIGLILAGFGLIFVGLEIMSTQFGNQNIKDAITKLFNTINNPFVLLLIGVVLTALTQSSSVVTSVIIAMASQGILIGGGGNAVLYVILGTNIGSCVTALLSSIGTAPNARRASLIHLLFNVFGSLIFFTIFICVPRFMELTFESWFKNPQVQIAMFHTLFNVICTIMFLPFSQVFVKISTKFIRDKRVSEQKSTYLDKRLLGSAEIALQAVRKEAASLMDRSMEMFEKALTDFQQVNINDLSKIDLEVDQINKSFQNITNYLIEISSADVNIETEKEICALHNSLGGILRVAELAQNFTKYTRRRERDGLSFSNQVIKDLDGFKDKIFELYKLVKLSLLQQKSQEEIKAEKIASESIKWFTTLERVDQLEDEVDNIRRRLVDAHIKRLNSGECKAESSSVFVSLVNNMERIADHLHTIAHNA